MIIKQRGIMVYTPYSNNYVNAALKQQYRVNVSKQWHDSMCPNVLARLVTMHEIMRRRHGAGLRLSQSMSQIFGIVMVSPMGRWYVGD